MTSGQSTDMTAAQLLAAADEALLEAGFRTGDLDAPERLARAAAERAARDGDKAGAAAAANLLGCVLHFRNIFVLVGGGSPEPAAVAAERELFAEALAGFQEVGDEPGSARAYFGLGLVEQVLNQDWDAAMVHYRRSESLIPALEAAGDLYTRSEIHRHLGFYHLVADRQTAVAVQHLQISLDLREEQGEARRVPNGLVALGRAEREDGNPRRAVLLLRRAVELSRAQGLLPAWTADAQRELEAAEQALGAELPG